MEELCHMLLEQRDGNGTTDFDAIKLLDKLLVGLFDDVEVLCKSRVELTKGDLMGSRSLWTEPGTCAQYWWRSCAAIMWKQRPLTPT